MKTNEFLELLNENRSKNLLFEYENGQFVSPGYHITEVKNITIDSVDCGADTNFWKETIIQLWENAADKNAVDYMSTGKALDILNKVDSIKPMDRSTEIKFEYGNQKFHTSQLFVNDFELQRDSLFFKLGVTQTDCKAKENCGVPADAVLVEEACCSPGGGCC
ncbi:MAG: hypothetical protein HKN31_02275 [Pricia sp.]|nr:hypothetical protein [Pricia sp.]